MRRLHVHLLPDLVDEADLAGATVVVIDVLRATTTIAHALAAGAREVYVCLEVQEARLVGEGMFDGQALRGGERGGLKIPGFDLGNSPAEYTPESVGGRTLVFTTTNGTRAMLRCRQAKHVLLGAFVNRAAVLNALATEDSIDLVCAGTRGKVTREDTLFAGSLVDALVAAQRDAWNLNDPALLARSAWIEAFPTSHAGTVDSAALASVLADTQGGRNLHAEGLSDDIPRCAQLDLLSIVPHFDPETCLVRK